MKAVLVSTGIALMSSVTAAATFAEIRITRVEVSYFAPTDAFVTELDDTEHVFRVTDTSPDALLDVFPGFEYRTFDVAGDSFVSAEVDYSLTVADDGRTIEYIPERCTYVIGYDTCIFPGSTETSFAEVIVGYVHPRGPHQYVSAWPAVVSLETPSAGPDFLTRSGTLHATLWNSLPDPADVPFEIFLHAAAYAAPIPEPRVSWMLLAGLAGVAGMRAKRWRQPDPARVGGCWSAGSAGSAGSGEVTGAAELTPFPAITRPSAR